MRITVTRNPKELGEEAARLAAQALTEAIRVKGHARLALTTGVSQLETLTALARRHIQWENVELVQVMERMNQDDGPSSCRKALIDRFARRVKLANAYLLDGTGESVAVLSEELRKEPVDVLLIGMGEQGQVGFNAAPADFETDEPFAVHAQADKPEETVVTMTIAEMLRCGRIILCAPYGMQAETVWQVVTHGLTPEIPATALKRHPELDILLERESAALVSVELAAEFNPNLESWRIFHDPENEEQ